MVAFGQGQPRLRLRGPVHADVRRSDRAELYAAAMAIRTAVDNGATDVLLVADNMGCVQAVEQITPAHEKLWLIMAEWIGQMPADLTLRAKHIHGHTKVGGIEWAENAWCDKHSRIVMRQARQEALAHARRMAKFAAYDAELRAKRAFAVDSDNRLLSGDPPNTA